MHSASLQLSAIAITRALQPAMSTALDRSHRHIDQAIAASWSTSRRAQRAARRNGAREFIRRPYQIGYLLNREGASIADLLPRCKHLVAATIECGRQGHWTFDSHRLIALRHAHLALRYLRRFGEAA